MSSVVGPNSVIKFQAWDKKRVDQPGSGLIGSASFNVSEAVDLSNKR